MNRSGRWIFGMCAALAVLFMHVREARADVTTTKLALVIANNRGAELGRTELRYADDDGAKYRSLFRATAETPSDVQLLARFDRDTGRLFTEPPDGPPTRAVLEQKVVHLAARQAELKRSGKDVELFFVYAGHGDIDRGKGFVQLEDGAFTADDLAALVRRVGATRTHVILDSCNSLFLVSPRKPGGRHVATADDAVLALRERLPRVGVFLSTSSDGEVFEWSELGAGIFSHAVRSGLSGAADADRDGEVSYEELRAFVDIATREVKNPRYRPKVFARGPDGNDQAALFSPRLARGRRLTLEGPTRTTLRDADDIPWVDAHVETGARAEIVIPASLDEGRGTQETLDVTSSWPKVVRRETLDATSVQQSEPVAARGPSELFRTLFVRPFGPRALAAEQPSPSTLEEQTYGLSRDDVTRFSTLLAQVADDERSRRHLAGLAFFGAGLVSGGMGALVLSRHDDEFSRASGMGYLATGIGFTLLSPLVGFRSGPGEGIRRDFERELARDGKPSLALSNAESKLFALARTERTYRYIGAAMLGLVVAAESVGFTLNELRPSPDPELRGVFATGLLISAVGGVMMLHPTPVERLAEVWRAEPSRPTSRWSFAPIGPAGPGVSVSARF